MEGGDGALAVHLMPRFVLHNILQAPLMYKQQGTTVERSLAPGGVTALQWSDAGCPLRLCLRVQEAGWLWSGGVAISSPGDLFIKIRHRSAWPILTCLLTLTRKNYLDTPISDLTPQPSESVPLSIALEHLQGVMPICMRRAHAAQGPRGDNDGQGGRQHDCERSSAGQHQPSGHWLCPLPSGQLHIRDSAHQVKH